MDYFKLLRRFWQLHNQVRLTAPETVLYCFLLEECNSLWWKNPFGYTNTALVARLGISEKTLISARTSLQAHGLLTFQPGRKNCPTTYQLLPPNKETAEPTNTTRIFQSMPSPGEPNAHHSLENTGSSLHEVTLPTLSTVARQYERTSALAGQLNQSPPRTGSVCDQAQCSADESPLANKAAFAQILQDGGYGDVDKELYRQQMLTTARRKQVMLSPARWHKWIITYLNNERRGAPLLPPQLIAPPTTESLRIKSNPNAIVI